VLQDYAGALHAEGAFAGLSWADAKNIAAAVSLEVTYRGDGAAFLRNRAATCSPAWVGWWENRGGAARALNIAATVLGL
jgi:hypothetical protein